MVNTVWFGPCYAVFNPDDDGLHKLLTDCAGSGQRLEEHFCTDSGHGDVQHIKPVRKTVRSGYCVQFTPNVVSHIRQQLVLDLGGGEKWRCTPLQANATASLGDCKDRHVRSDSFVVSRILQERALHDLVAEFARNNAHRLGVHESSPHEKLLSVDWLQCQQCQRLNHGPHRYLCA